MSDSARLICGKPVSRSENAKKSGTPIHNALPVAPHRQGIEMPDMPTFDEALRKQREAFADRYEANEELSKYVDGLFSENEERSDD